MTALPCGCCEPADPGPAIAPRNGAGLDQLTWRVRRHPEFLVAMMTAISRTRSLRALRTRESDDPTIALLDAWAAVGDVLTFYTERIANEGFIRTATERRSLADLAAMVGYELQPGVAAETHLAFALETAVGAPEAVTIPGGTRVQSLPGPDEQPVVFETVQDLAARAEWCTVPADPTDDSRPATALAECLAAGPLAARSGDVLVFVRHGGATSAKPDDPGIAFATVDGTTPMGGSIRLQWSPPLPDAVGRDGARLGPGSGDVTVHHPSVARPFGYNAPDWRTLPAEVVARFGGGEPTGDWARLTMDDIGLPVTSVLSRKHASGTRDLLKSRETRAQHGSDVIHLDGDDLGVRAGDLMVLVDEGAGRVESFRALAVVTTSVTDFSLTRPVTRVTLSGQRSQFTNAVRTTVAYLLGPALELAAFPRHEPYTDTRVPLARTVTPLPDGRLVAASGRRAWVEVVGATLHFTPVAGGAARELPAGVRLVVLAPPEPASGGSAALRWRLQDSQGRDGTVVATRAALRCVAAPDDGPTTAELVIAAAPDDTVASARELALRQPLAQWYDPATLRFDGNVARATHGESTTEVLGGGDAAVPSARYPLRQAPLTYRATADGATSTLVVSVDGSPWQEQPTLFGSPRDAHAYTLRHVDDDVVVQFGDGHSGARPPTGQENVTARYRIGSGRAGNVRAGALSQLRSRPLGVKGVTNPLAAEGGDDPESVEQARRDAPLRVRTLDRVVSIADYEDFAAAYPGVGRARASWLWDGQRRTVHLTCTGPDGGSLPGLTRSNLRNAISAASDGLQPFTVAAADLVAFVVTARLYLATAPAGAGNDSGAGLAGPGRDEILTAAAAALIERFAAPARPLARPVPASEVIATLHAMPAVRGVDLIDFRLDAAQGPRVATSLPAAPARLEDGVARPAQLLALDPARVRVLA